MVESYQKVKSNTSHKIRNNPHHSTVGVFNYKDIYCEMKQLIRHILREHTSEIGEERVAHNKKTTEDFVKDAKKIHGNNYDYSKVKYVNSKTPIKIICPKHGNFQQTPNVHLRGSGCPECGLLIKNEKRKGTFEDFVEKSKQIHGEKYLYNKSKFDGNTKNTSIKCPVHGLFQQTPAMHMQGQACPKCGVEKRSSAATFNSEKFIENAKKVHGNKYDYSKVDYEKSDIPVIITCPIHGDFSIKPNNHVSQKQGCRECGYESVKIKNSLGIDEFLKFAKKIHKNKYDYSKVEYRNSREPVKIICKKHGEFLQAPSSHLSGQGCPLCSRKIINTQDFISQAKNIHGDKFDYSKTQYNGPEKLVVICPTHGEFLVTPYNHLKGADCPKCNIEHMTNILTMSTDEFISRAKKIHGGKYEYTNVDYEKSDIPVIITCPVHGDFKQNPAAHLSGQGCPICRESKGEKIVNDILKFNKIDSIRQHKFLDCTNNLTGRYCRALPFDFYLPKMNTCVEYDGAQHYLPVWGEKDLKKVQKNDKIKNQYCKKNGIKLIRIPYTMKKEDIEPYILKELGIN
jgi:hypothetical protein